MNVLKDKAKKTKKQNQKQFRNNNLVKYVENIVNGSYKFFIY